MNRRDFLKGMASLGLVLPSTRTIFDMGANAHKYPKEFIGFDIGGEFDTLVLLAVMQHGDGRIEVREMLTERVGSNVSGRLEASESGIVREVRLQLRGAELPLDLNRRDIAMFSGDTLNVSAEVKL